MALVELSLGTMDGLAPTVEVDALAGPAVNVTVAVCVTSTPSLVSVASNTTGPAVVDLTLKVATPELSEVREAGEIVGAPGPDVFASVTVFPLAGLL